MDGHVDIVDGHAAPLAHEVDAQTAVALGKTVVGRERRHRHTVKGEGGVADAEGDGWHAEDAVVADAPDAHGRRQLPLALARHVGGERLVVGVVERTGRGAGV